MTDPFPNIDLSVLTPRQREVVEMHYIDRLTFGQIAAILGISKSSVQVHNERAMSKLTERMRQHCHTTADYLVRRCIC